MLEAVRQAVLINPLRTDIPEAAKAAALKQTPEVFKDHEHHVIRNLILIYLGYRLVKGVVHFASWLREINDIADAIESGEYLGDTWVGRTDGHIDDQGFRIRDILGINDEGWHFRIPGVLEIEVKFEPKDTGVQADIVNSGRRTAAQLATIARTEANNVENIARLEEIKQQGYTHYELVAILDDRTTEICREKDGQVFKVEDYWRGVTAPPFHFNCRTVIQGTGDKS
jgi:SPP1 gp7 family putative phage head morphogenesis protein